MDVKQLLDFVQTKLDEMKAHNIVVLDIQGQSTMMDYMVIAEGTSSQHVRAIANHLKTASKHHTDITLFGSEGDEKGDWVLVDVGDVIVHIMLKETRDYYQLEKLWSVDIDHTPKTACDSE